MKLSVIALLGLACAVAAVHGQTLPLVAVHDSELTRALETNAATGATPTGPGTTSNQWWLVNWHYFVLPDSVKEALRSDGTAFTVLSDANIGAGQLLDSNGAPKYPILISLASEAVADGEIAQLTNYVAAGGTLLVGSSAFTRMTNGNTRGDFAIANAMGVHMVNASLVNWAENQTFSRIASHPLVAHIPGGVLNWDMPVSADETPLGTWPNFELSVGHLIWQVQASNALVIAQGDNDSPYLTTSTFGKGVIIYVAALEPFLGHGGYAPGMYAYGMLRNAVQGAFAAANLPIPKLSPWPYAYDAALSVRHNFDDLQDQISSIAASAHFEYTNGAKGDYHFCTGTLRVQMTNSPAVIAGLCAAVTNYGATIGPENGGLANPNNPSLPVTNYDYWHWGPDEALDMAATNLQGYSNGAAYTFASISNSFLDVEGWLGSLTNGLRLTAAPDFNATREASYQIEQALGVNASGEQKLGPFPSWVLSTQTPDLRYPFISLPTSEWYGEWNGLPPQDVAQDMEIGITPTTMQQMVDFYYGWGALINLYSHSSSAGTGIAGSLASEYVTYSMSKPRIWPANSADIYTWWLARSNAQVSATYSTNGNHSVVDFTISGASDPRTSVEVLVPRLSVSGLQVWTNGVLAGTNNYRTNGPVIKILVGTAITNAQVSYLPNPEIQSNFYVANENKQLSAPAPGTLTNALLGAGTVLTAMLVGSPADGTFSLTNNGGFSYLPLSNFTGIDSFTYQANDGLATSSVSRTLIDVVPPGDLFFDNFIRSTNSDPLAPWVPALGQWTISGGQLLGINPDPGTFSDAYVDGNWTNYSVQAQIQFPATGFAGGLDGRVNPASGAKYTVNVYPNGFPGMGTNSLMMLWKFHSWQILSSTQMALITLPTAVGTNWHTLKITFRGNEIVVYFDGTQEIDVTDNNFDGLPPYAGGGIAAHFFTYLTPYVLAFENIEVTTAPVAANDFYTDIQNRTLTVAAPGVLANDAPGLGTNLTAVLVSGPTNGVLNLGTNGGFSYTPATNYVGPDSFTYQANDGVSSSAVAVVTITVVSNSPPVANNDAYTYTPNTTLTVPAPGVLANDTDVAGDSLSAVLVSGPAWGTLALNTNGGFTYTPGTNFNGTDTFTYVAADGTVTGDVATVTLTDPAAGSLFYDNFARSNLAPWVVYAGAWALTNGELQGGTDPGGTYGNIYLTNSWSDYAVAGQFQFGPDAYGGGLGGRLNPLTGAHYAAWIYPFGNDFNLVKFTSWAAPNFLATVSLPPLGTNWHSLKLAFRGNQIAVYLDGSMLTTVTDSTAPLLNGGVSVDMYTDGSPYAMSVENIIVDPLVISDNYYMNENQMLSVGAPGVLGNDTGVYGTNLTAALVSGPTWGILSLNSNGGFNYTPATNYAGMDAFSYLASDGQTNLGTNSVTILISGINTNTGPTLPIQTNLTINELAALVVTNTASDPASPPEILTYTLVSPPTNAVIDTNGIIHWTPGQAQAPSTNLITTIVSDNGTPSLSATNSFTVVVNDLNSAPVLPAQTNRTILGLAPLVVSNLATELDIHVTSLTYLLASSQTNTVIDTNGTITWTPVAAQVPSTNTITTVVTNYDPYAVNGQSLSATNSFTVVLHALHNGPSLPAQTNLTINELAAMMVTNTAVDTDSPPTTLTYTLVNPPTNAVISTNGIIHWTPSQAQAPSTNTIKTIVSDNGAPSLSATNSFTVVVNDLNSAPVLPVQGNRTIFGLVPLVVTNTASEADIHVTSLSYLLTSAPTNAVIDTNGIIHWTPVAAQVPSTNVITTVVTNYDPYAVNGQSLSATNSFTVVLHALHNGPSLPAQTNLTINELAAMMVTNTAVDTDSPPTTLTYTLVNPPTNAVISTNGIIHWTPSQAQAPSTNTIKTIVSDNGAPSLSATNSFTVVVNDLNSAPVLPVQGNRTIFGLVPLVVTNTASEADIHVTSLSYLLTSAPTNAVIDTNGIIHWTPVAAQVPSTNVITTVVTNYDPYAVNGQSLSATNSFTVVLQAMHTGPTLPILTNLTINELSALVVTNTAVDTDSPPTTLTYTLVSPPTNAVIDTNGIITWTPAQAQAPSTNLITTIVSDNVTPSLSATNSFTAVVNDLNSAPVLPAQTNRTILGLAPLVVSNLATELDIHVTSLTYLLASSQTNTVIDTNGTITWTPVAAQVPSTNTITTVVTNYDPYAVNGTSLSATNSFTVVLLALHNGPSLPAQTNLTINELSALVVTNTAVDTDSPPTTLTYTLVSPPTNATIDTNGIITWTPGQAQAPSTNLITTIVSDNGAPSLSATNSFTVVVNDLNSAPVLPVQGNRTIFGLVPLVVTNTASEADIHVTSLSYLLTSAPTNAVIDTNGTITWTPVAAQVPSTNTITTVVTNYDPYAVNGTSLSATNSFTVVLLALHNGPSLPAQTNLTINELAAMMVTNTAVDTDSPPTTLTYTLVSPPTNATIDTNGIITWTPGQAQAPSTNLITTIVSDNGAPSLSATNSFTVVVNDLNSAPVLPVQGNRTIFGLVPLVVTNTASEADIHVTSLSYLLTSAPTNAVIDTNGTITWTPVAAQVPSTNTITTVVTNYDPYAVNGQSLSATNSFTVVLLALHNGPSLPAQTNLTINELSALVVTNTAMDTDSPPTTLTYTLVSPPTNAMIDTNGIIHWTPDQAQAPSTNLITTVVRDNGTPSLSATNSFTVVVNSVNLAFSIRSIGWSHGVATIAWNSISGQTYRLMFKTNLTDTNWQSAAPDVTAASSITSTTNGTVGVPYRFYRILLLP